MDLTIGSTHFKITLAWLGWAATAVFVLLFLKVGGGSSFETAWAGAKHELATYSAYKAQLKRMSDRAAASEAKAHALEADTMKLRVGLDSAIAAALRANQGVDTASRTGAQRAILAVGDACHAEIANCAHRATLWESVARQQGARADLATARSFTSDSTLRSVGGAGECHLLHVGPIKAFGCPSRVTAFKVGLVGGAGVVEALRLLLTGHF
jgi:hypothetical protein